MLPDAGWTQSEVGGLDTSTFVTPQLVHFPTFDSVDGNPRMIPAFYYRTDGKTPAAGGKSPVVIDIHGGPEGQAVPIFYPYHQLLVRELGVGADANGGSVGSAKLPKLDTPGNAMIRSDIGALLD